MAPFPTLLADLTIVLKINTGNYLAGICYYCSIVYQLACVCRLAEVHHVGSKARKPQKKTVESKRHLPEGKNISYDPNWNAVLLSCLFRCSLYLLISLYSYRTIRLYSKPALTLSPGQTVRMSVSWQEAADLPASGKIRTTHPRHYTTVVLYTTINLPYTYHPFMRWWITGRHAAYLESAIFRLWLCTAAVQDTLLTV